MAHGWLISFTYCKYNEITENNLINIFTNITLTYKMKYKFVLMGRATNSFYMMDDLSFERENIHKLYQNDNITWKK